MCDFKKSERYGLGSLSGCRMLINYEEVTRHITGSLPSANTYSEPQSERRSSYEVVQLGRK